MFGETAFCNCGESTEDKTNTQISTLYGEMTNSHVPEIPCLLGLSWCNLSAEGAVAFSGKALSDKMVSFPH